MRTEVRIDTTPRFIFEATSVTLEGGLFLEIFDFGWTAICICGVLSTEITVETVGNQTKISCSENHIPTAIKSLLEGRKNFELISQQTPENLQHMLNEVYQSLLFCIDFVTTSPKPCPAAHQPQ